ncbi:MAG: RimK/LysX family protein [Bacteroidota bacterium]
MSGLVTVGWREWVAFPDLGLPAVRCKVDTGAATSSLHATHIQTLSRGGTTWARFSVRPFFRRHRTIAVICEAPVVDERHVRSSSGHEDLRLVVEVTFRLGVRAGSPEWPIELTLADRASMQFPMLLGREAMAGHVAVDPGASFRLGRVENARALYEVPEG